jgi:hypothetical protein
MFCSSQISLTTLLLNFYSLPLLTEYPTLKELDFTFDLNKEEAVQVERALADMASKCNNRLHVAREDWQRRYNLARQVHFEAIRKSEDEERQNREREEKRRQEAEKLRQNREREDNRRQDEEKLRQNREREEKRKQKEEELRQNHEREENRSHEEEEQRQNREREENHKLEEEVQRLNREREEYLRQDVELKRQNLDREETRHYNERVGKRRQEKGGQRQHCVREEKRRLEEEAGNCYREKERCGQDNEGQLRYYRKNVEKHMRCKRERGEKRRQKEEQRHRSGTSTSSSNRQSDAERSQVGEVKENPEEKKYKEQEYHEKRPRQNDKGNSRHLKSGERQKRDEHEQARSDLTRQNHHLHQKTNEKHRSINGAEGLESKRKVCFRDNDKADEVERPKKRRKESSSTVVSLNDKKESSSIRVRVRKKSYSELLPHGFMQRAENRSNHKSSEGLGPCKSDLFGSLSTTSSKHGSIDEKALISGNRYDASLTKRAKELEGNAKTNTETIRQPRTSARNKSEQNSIDAAPLVEAALTAASQETVRVSQTSAHFRSRHKRSILPSQPKSKMHDAFGSSDEGFLHFRSPSESKKLNNTRVISAVHKPQRCRDNHLKSRSNDSFAAPSHVPTELPNQSKHIAPVRVRKKKQSHKGASQSSIDEDFGFL